MGLEKRRDDEVRGQLPVGDEDQLYHENGQTMCERLHADIKRTSAAVSATTSESASRFPVSGRGLRGILFSRRRAGTGRRGSPPQSRHEILKAVDEVNNNQKHVLFEKIRTHFEGI